MIQGSPICGTPHLHFQFPSCSGLKWPSCGISPWQTPRYSNPHDPVNTEVQPRMPHACPHLAAPVVEVPKVLVRGEVRTVRSLGLGSLLQKKQIFFSAKSRPFPMEYQWISSSSSWLGGQTYPNISKNHSSFASFTIIHLATWRTQWSFHSNGITQTSEGAGIPWIRLGGTGRTGAHILIIFPLILNTLQKPWFSRRFTLIWDQLGGGEYWGN